MENPRLPAAVVVLLLYCLPFLSARGAEPAATTPASQPAALGHALDSVQWAGPTPALNAIRGKSVVLLVYATWCPKCNAWSGEFFGQLRETVRDKPVVVLAVDADDSPAGVEKYLTERGFFGPNIFHGYDPSITRRLGLDSNLYHYVLVGPDGSPAGSGSAGAFYETPQGREFALPRQLASSERLGTFDFITPEMSEEVRLLFWPWELGGGSEPALRSAQKKLAPDQKEQVDAAINRYLDAQLERIRGLYKGTVVERLDAHESAARLSAVFRSTEQSKKAKKVVSFLERDQEFKRELAAKKVYDGAMLRADARPSQRARSLRTAAKRYAGTHYGSLAEEALASTESQ